MLMSQQSSEAWKNLIKNERTVRTALWYGPVKCTPLSKLKFQIALPCEWCGVPLDKVVVDIWRQKRVKSPVHLCSLNFKKKKLCCVGFRKVVGCYIVKIFRTLWVLTLCLITVTNIYCLNAVNGCTTETLTYHVYSQNKHISINGESLSPFTIIPADTKMLQTYLIFCVDIGFFSLWNLCVYIQPWLSIMYSLLLQRSSQRWDRCIVWPPTCLGISAWRKCCDCVTMTQPSWATLRTPPVV